MACFGTGLEVISNTLEISERIYRPTVSATSSSSTTSTLHLGNVVSYTLSNPGDLPIKGILFLTLSVYSLCGVSPNVGEQCIANAQTSASPSMTSPTDHIAEYHLRGQLNGDVHRSTHTWPINIDLAVGTPVSIYLQTSQSALSVTGATLTADAYMTYIGSSL